MSGSGIGAKGWAMPIEIPSLHSTLCVNLTACGELVAPAKEGRERLAQVDDNMIARYRGEKGTGYVRVMVGDKHVHVDCAVPRYFEEGLLPKVTHRKADVLAVLQIVLGAEIKVGVAGSFRIPMQQVPEQGLIRNLQTKTQSGGLSLEVTGAKLSIEGAPVGFISWEIPRSHNEAYVKIVGARHLRIAPSYLSDCLEWITRQMQFFVLGKTENGPH
jgi:hypothetical protein